MTSGRFFLVWRSIYDCVSSGQGIRHHPAGRRKVWDSGGKERHGLLPVSPGQNPQYEGGQAVPLFWLGQEKYRPPEKPLVSREERWRRVETRCFRALCRYYHLLGDWERDYAPKAPEEPLHPLFLDAVEKKNGLAYRLDVLRCGSLAEKAAVVAESGKEVKEIERRIAEFAGRDPAGAGRSRRNEEER